jgi:hypothetical protein
MTPPDERIPRKHAKTSAALALQIVARMRLIPAACAVLAFAASARAQTTTNASAGSCTGMLAGQVGLAVPDGTGNYQTIQTAAVSNVFDFAECACPPAPADQIAVEILLTTALPLGTTGTAEMWVGSGCDNYTTRTTASTTACEKLAAIDITQFTTGSQTSGRIHLPVPGNALASPVAHMCTQATASNAVYLFFFTDPMSPFASCTLQLTQQNQGPTAVVSPQAGSGDGAINLTWTNPPPGSYTAKQFQVLCSDDSGQPITNSPPAPLYSTCVNGVLERRQEQTGGTLNGVVGDGGTLTTGDGGTASLIAPGGTLHTDATPLDGGAPDMAENPIWLGDGGFGPLSTLDKRFVCSSMIGATSTSARITGLKNNQVYHFVILSIDNFGNATPSTPVTGVPEPVQDLYRRYRDAGGASGSCFIATAAFGSYESGWVHVLRDFRDQSLLPTDLGRDFVAWYYAHSPPAAQWIARHGWARVLTRIALVPVIAVAAFWLYCPPWLKALAILAMMAYALRRRLAAALHGGKTA